MKIKEINHQLLRRASNQELLGLHRRVHQLWSLAKTKNYNKDHIRYAHDDLVHEMKSRGMKHNTPLSENSNYLNNYLKYLTS